METTRHDLDSVIVDALVYNEKAIWNFISEKKMDALGALLDERFICVSLQGGLFDKSTYLHGMEHNLKIQKTEVLSTQVTLYENTALTISRVSTEMLYHGIRHQGPLLVTRTWIKVGRDWKIILTTSNATQVGDAWKNLLSTPR